MSKTASELLVRALERIKMKCTGSEDRTSTEPAMSARLGVGSWIILIVLLSLLIATGVVIYRGWTLGEGTDVPASGYCRDDIRGDYFTGRRVRPHGAYLLQQPKRI